MKKEEKFWAKTQKYGLTIYEKEIIIEVSPPNLEFYNKGEIL